MVRSLSSSNPLPSRRPVYLSEPELREAYATEWLEQLDVGHKGIHARILATYLAHSPGTPLQVSDFRTSALSNGERHGINFRPMTETIGDRIINVRRDLMEWAPNVFCQKGRTRGLRLFIDPDHADKLLLEPEQLCLAVNLAITEVMEQGILPQSFQVLGQDIAVPYEFPRTRGTFVVSGKEALQRDLREVTCFKNNGTNMAVSEGLLSLDGHKSYMPGPGCKWAYPDDINRLDVTRPTYGCSFATDDEGDFSVVVSLTGPSLQEISGIDPFEAYCEANKIDPLDLSIAERDEMESSIYLFMEMLGKHTISPKRACFHSVIKASRIFALLECREDDPLRWDRDTRGANMKGHVIIIGEDGHSRIVSPNSLVRLQ